MSHPRPAPDSKFFKGDVFVLPFSDWGIESASGKFSYIIAAVAIEEWTEHWKKQKRDTLKDSEYIGACDAWRRWRDNQRKLDPESYI